jgi:predicted nucleotidyltransferase component of viral defense system
MLHYNTINTKTLALLKAIQRVDLFKNLRLVGGTALALQIGHRLSVDLDLFGLINSDKLSIVGALNKIGKIKTIQQTENINIYTVDNIKVDVVNYEYPWLKPQLVQENLRLASLPDIAAMKLAAITGRGSKKDFIDIYYLLKRYTFEELLLFYNNKYHDGSTFLVLRSLAYFDDANSELMPKMFKSVSWDVVKRDLSEKLKEYIDKSES